MNYTYRYKSGTLKKGKYKGKDIAQVILKDGTKITLLSPDIKNTLLLYFPKKKFAELFQKQINDKKIDYISISFSLVETLATFEGLTKGYADINKQKTKKCKK